LKFFMCACGCFLLVAIAGALVYCVMHGLWLAAAGVVALTVAIAWFGRKAMQARSNPPKGR
jgi:membrane protein implicated in regulation of membrane protease activity